MWSLLRALALDIIATLNTDEHLLDLSAAVVPNIECARHTFRYNLDNRLELLMSDRIE